MQRALTTAKAAVAVALLLFAAPRADAQDPPPRHVERVDVARVIVDTRVIHNGQPLLGLDAADFVVRIDGKPARVESVQWVGGTSEGSVERPATFSVSEAARPREGRLIVFLFQKSLERGRITGFMRMLLDLRGFIDGFTPNDRIAVLSFDTRLRLWLDFTADVERIRRVLARNLLFGGPAPVSAVESPSLGEKLGERASRTYDIESALRLIGDALKPLPGAKSLVLVGHGFGRLGLGNGVMMEHNYAEARQALQDARASVFCLDVTLADYHSLEAGLQMVAEDTGGFFERTHIFGQLALERLRAVLDGHYVLFVEKPESRTGRHRIDVRLKNRAGTVLARNAFVD